MNDIEKQLRGALRRCEPPANFANRVLARVEAENPRVSQPSRTTGWHWPRLLWAPLAAMLLLAAAGTGYRVHQQRVEVAQALAAKRQVMIALRITGTKLRIVQQRVRAVEDAQKTGRTL